MESQVCKYTLKKNECPKIKGKERSRQRRKEEGREA